MLELALTFSNPLGSGVEAKDLSVLQVCIRGTIVFTCSLIMVRVAHKRFLAKRNAFDVILVLILGSMLARAINGSEPLFPTLVAGFLLVLFHYLVETLTYRYPRVSGWVKGHTNLLVQKGQIDEKIMRKHGITLDDLKEELRLQGNLESIEDAKYAYLERNGQVGVIKNNAE